MAEYIEKQLVLSKSQQDYLEGRYDYDDFVLVSDIESIPPADVRPVVRGRWEWNEDDGHCYCTVCGSVSPEIDQNGDECDCPNFCPHRGSYNGADMRGDDTE